MPPAFGPPTCTSRLDIQDSGIDPTRTLPEQLAAHPRSGSTASIVPLNLHYSASRARRRLRGGAAAADSGRHFGVRAAAVAGDLGSELPRATAERRCKAARRIVTIMQAADCRSLLDERRRAASLAAVSGPRAGIEHEQPHAARGLRHASPRQLRRRCRVGSGVGSAGRTGRGARRRGARALRWPPPRTYKHVPAVRCVPLPSHALRK